MNRDNWSDDLPRVDCGVEKYEPEYHDWSALAKQAGNELVTLVVILAATGAAVLIAYLYARGGQ